MWYICMLCICLRARFLLYFLALFIPFFLGLNNRSEIFAFWLSLLRKANSKRIRIFPVKDKLAVSLHPWTLINDESPCGFYFSKHTVL